MSIDKLDQLVFVGFNGYAAALDRDTGEIVWSNNNLKSGYVTVFLDGDRLIVSTNGYMFCLDPYTGRTIWHNPMTGYGYGPTSIASTRGNTGDLLNAQAAADAAARASSGAAAGAAAS
jgi:outer membrane protein assembly factor BamB